MITGRLSQLTFAEFTDNVKDFWLEVTFNEDSICFSMNSKDTEEIAIVMRDEDIELLIDTMSKFLRSKGATK